MTKLGKHLKAFETRDYQNRKGNYPKENVTDSITFEDDSSKKQMTLSFDFKNTTEKNAKQWVIDFLEKNSISKNSYIIESYQDGDYENDWVIVKAKFKR